ncbi:MAG: DNA-directed RNA polymerase subunit beta', partial [bacterium]
GKKGRFRQNLLGKRVDYSGRAVIVVGPELKLYQCGLPKSMALELFKPFVLRKLSELGITQTIKTAKKYVEREKPEVWDILEEITRDHPVLLNRAPTLHRLSIQAFYPVLIDGKAIQIHPLVCAPFNADFDGDQMAVHVPLTYEARHIMLSALNILSPAHGKPLTVPSQDMVLGCYYLTKEKSGGKGEGKVFSSPKEAIIAYDQGIIELHSKIKVRINGKLIETTCGRVIFNEKVPHEVGFYNGLVVKSVLEDLVARSYDKAGLERTIVFLDDLKELGFYYATIAAISIGIDDLIVPPEKEKIVSNARKEVEKVFAQYRRGLITDGERYNKTIDIWTQSQNEITEILFDRLLKYNQGFNPLAMMVDSKARGSRDQVRQLAGLRGLMSKPQKRLTGQEIIETPILSNFKDGLTVLEYFISSHGGRKGLADTALKTADAGYLTRRLVDVAQDVIITEDDCGTIQGVERGALKDG